MASAPDAVLEVAKQLLERGLVEGTSGNVSARQEDGSVVITASSVDYERMELEDLVVLSSDGSVLRAREGRSPSSEMLLHLACYEAFDDIGSVIHSHPVHVTMFAVAREDIPACIDEMPVFIGGDVRCSRYAASGSADVGKSAVDALQGRGAALLANHGLVAVAPNPAAALRITALVERSAQIVWGARSLGRPHPLPEHVGADLAAVYGYVRQNPPSASGE